MFKRFISVPKVQIGLGIMGFFTLVAIFGKPFATHVLHRQPTDVFLDAMGVGPSLAHPMGTTVSGQDVLTWMLHGTYNSMFVGFVSAIIATIIALVIGTLAGFLGGWADNVINAFILVFQNIPSFPVLIIMAAFWRDMPLVVVALMVGIFEWTGGARRIRAQTLSLRNRDFTTALRTVGEGKLRIVMVEVMPHLFGIVSPMFLTAIAAGVSMQASIAMLGIGSAGEPSWGLIINYAFQQNALFRGMWWWFVPPGIALALLGFATTMVNFGLDEVTNPTLSSKRMKLMTKFKKKLRMRDSRALPVEVA
ncbi:peptide/nickel transport system permease protein [Tessaracoccus bendigoensis DSM 12906]|uniref:Peptide/nickel transport system permease protein n=1 Tax=Tessaracoccus bendigoensis DSM 12906 TaxID=1123357 RepID=A0A1M6B8G5_9ACTN|nr:ABC transporter permease [Tessaracoccus bendigoensis]SHI45024.1 peptide/nickel transport system permease protein [Tessaracoccus bendigoensis DSM 12906]